MTEEFSDPGKQTTRDFLEGIKQAIASPATRYDGWLLVKRSDTIECIAELGLTLDDVRDAILGLSVADYCEGPLHDRNMPGDLWVFGKVMEGREVYIKLKLAKIGPVKRVRVVSFHFPKEPLCYPYRPEEQKERRCVMDTAVRGFCSNCEKETRLELVTKEEVIRVRNKPIRIELQYLRCVECGDEVFDPGLNVDPFSLAYRKYRKEYGFLQPEEIREWRKANKLTQGELAKLLGVGGVTISRYENGALQDPSHEKLLRLAMNPSNLLQLIEGSEGVFTESKKRRLIEGLEQVEAGGHSIDSTIMVSFGNYEPNEYSGYKKLDLERLYNAILFFCKEGMLKTKLNKLLFYADFKHYKEYAISITGARYAHIPFGPAPDNYEIYYGALSSQKAIEFIEEVYPPKYAGEPVVGEIIKATKKPDLSLFTASELRIMASVQEDFKKYNAREITEFSHKEAAYQETQHGAGISYNYARNLSY